MVYSEVLVPINILHGGGNVKERDHLDDLGVDAVIILRYTGCPRRNVKYFGRVFLMLNYTDITQNTYI